MELPILACGPWFAHGEVGVVASLVMFLLVKPLAYFAFIQAFRFRVSRPIPMTRWQAAKLAGLRTMLGLVLVGGGTLALIATRTPHGVLGALVYLYAARLGAWWLVGSVGAHLRGWRLLGWTLSGTAINVAFDFAAYGGLVEGWGFLLGGAVVIAVFIAILDVVGRRDALRRRFTMVPHCRNCAYNLTGNLSGICPECGTVIESPTIEPQAAGGVQA